MLVYKVDRLTRSLADFAKLIELFEAHSVSFVSVTQSFNTRSSMGRLTLNVLLSFAQFERELIGERVRDKIAASKRKGIWVGGPVPLGYAAVDKKIVVVPAEAEAVRTIFERYLDLGSVRMLADDLDHRGIRSKPRPLSNGRSYRRRRASAWGRSPICSRTGSTSARWSTGARSIGATTRRSWSGRCSKSVQAKLAAQTVARRCRLRGSPALLTGRLFDDRGHRMSPSHTNKGGVRYRYYVSQALLQGKLQGAGSIGRVPAAEIEALVLTALRHHLQASGAEAQPTADSDRDLIERHVERITLTPKHIKLQMRPSSDAAPAGMVAEDPGHNAIGDLRVATIAIPWTGPMPATVKGIIHVPAHNTPIKPARRETLLTAIAKARQWVDDMAQGRTATFAQIARREGKVERHVRLLAPLAFLSPRIVAAIIDGTAPADLTVTSLARALPYSWAEQESRRLPGITPVQENDVLLEPSMPVPT